MDNCIVCKTEFPTKYHKKGVKKLCCSRACSYKHLGKKEMLCKTCNKSFRAHGLRRYKEYCSLSCVQRDPCQVCGTIITGRAKFQNTERKFCSRKCSGISKISFTKFNYIAKGFAQTIKKFGKIQCEICEQDNIDYLVVHHIDENRKNNEFNNLKTVCANCHHKIHFGSSNNKNKNIYKAMYMSKNI